MASVDYRDYVLNIETLEARLKHRRPGRTPAILKHLDIGTFPHISPTLTQEVPQRPPGEKFHFLKWVHRSNNSDLAVVKLQNDPVMKILKIHKRESTFLTEKAAYDRLKLLGIQSTGAVLECYGSCMVTPKSFSHSDPPTCSGNEEGEYRVEFRGKRDPSLPKRVSSLDSKATYSWDNPTEKRMMELGVDFRPPSVDQSWSWVLDNSQFGPDGQWLPSGENLPYKRHALLLEYLPDSRRVDADSITLELARKGLDGFQTIQKALVMHRDHSRKNLLLTPNGRAVWIDFDRAIVVNEVKEDGLMVFKRHLIEVHGILFGTFYELPSVQSKKPRSRPRPAVEATLKAASESKVPLEGQQGHFQKLSERKEPSQRKPNTRLPNNHGKLPPSTPSNSIKAAFP